MSKKIDQIEQWIPHPDISQETSEWLMLLYPFIKSTNEHFYETIYIDMDRVKNMFDDQKVPIKERWDSDNSYWTRDNPLPFNSIGDDQELLALWPTFNDNPNNSNPNNSNPNNTNPNDTKKEVTNFLFPQSRSDVQWMMDIRNQHNNIIIVVCSQLIEVGVLNEKQNTDLIKVPVTTAYMIQILDSVDGKGIKKNVKNYILTKEPNTKFSWYCRACCKLNSGYRCPNCVDIVKLNDAESDAENYSKLGTYYCNVKCQKDDWQRHKQVCFKKS